MFEAYIHAGNYEALFDEREFASGVYLYRLQSEKISISKKFVLTK